MFRFKSEGDRTAIVCALRVAKERYEEHVKELAGDPKWARLADQFTRQARDAERLAQEVEDADEL